MTSNTQTIEATTTATATIASTTSTSPESILLLLLQGPRGVAFEASNHGWNKNVPVCDWSGITCSSSSSNGSDGIDDIQIERIILKNANLQGTTIPTEFGVLLTSLKQLTISNSGLVGTIPNELLSSSSSSSSSTFSSTLEIFDVSHNQLSGTIPIPSVSSSATTTTTTPSSSNNNKLKVYSIGHNQLSGTIPSELLSPATMPNLQSFTAQVTCANLSESNFSLRTYFYSLLFLFLSLACTYRRPPFVVQSTCWNNPLHRPDNHSRW